jgi:hypothetical protein
MLQTLPLKTFKFQRQKKILNISKADEGSISIKSAEQVYSTAGPFTMMCTSIEFKHQTLCSC